MSPLAVLLSSACLISLALLVLAVRFSGDALRWKRLLDGSERSYARMEADYLGRIERLADGRNALFAENRRLREAAGEPKRGRTRKLKVNSL